MNNNDDLINVFSFKTVPRCNKAIHRFKWLQDDIITTDALEKSKLICKFRYESVVLIIFIIIFIIYNNYYPLAIVISTHNDSVPAIREHITPQDALAGACKRICVDEPSDLGIIVPALQVIQPRLGIVVVPPIPNGVDACHRARCIEDPAPGVVAVLRHRRAGAVHNADHITLEVLAVEVLRLGVPGDVGEADDCAFGVVVEEQRIAPRDLRCQRAAPVDIAVNLAANSLPRPQARLVVLEAQAGGAFFSNCQLPSALPGEGPAPVARRIAHAVIGIGLPS